MTSDHTQSNSRCLSVSDIHLLALQPHWLTGNFEYNTENRFKCLVDKVAVEYSNDDNERKKCLMEDGSIEPESVKSKPSNKKKS